MADSTTVQISIETKSFLDDLKQPKESYNAVIARVLRVKSDPRYVTLRMAPEEYNILRNRQDWKICMDILRDARQ